MAIADAGTTAHFVLSGTPVTNISPGKTPSVKHLYDGKTIESTRTCKLSIPLLPNEGKISHIVPGLVHSSLVYIIVLCDEGFKVIYEGHTCNLYFINKLLWQGIK